MTALVSPLLSLRVSRAHIVILASLPKQINRQTKQILTATIKRGGRKPPSTSIMTDTNGTESDEASRHTHVHGTYCMCLKHRPGYMNVLAHNTHTIALHTRTKNQTLPQTCESSLTSINVKECRGYFAPLVDLTVCPLKATVYFLSIVFGVNEELSRSGEAFQERKQRSI